MGELFGDLTGCWLGTKHSVVIDRCLLLGIVWSLRATRYLTSSLSLLS